MTEENTPPKPESIDVIYNLALARLDAQLRDADTALGRIGTVWSVAGLVLAVVAGFISTEGTSIPIVTLIFAALCAATFIAIMVLGFKAFAFLGLQNPPKVSAVWEEALFWEPTITKRQIVSQIVPAIEFNESILRSRIKYTSLVLYLLPVEVILATIAVICIYFLG